MIGGLGDTIVALATPKGVSALAVIRISGTRAWEITKEFFRKPNGSVFRFVEPRKMVYGWFFDHNMQPVDEAQITKYAKDSSPTGEELIELFCHGGYGVVERILDCFHHFGVRSARPGEFTFRGFVNGKVDLIQAQAIHDLIQTVSPLATNGFSQVLRGVLSEQISEIRQTILDIASSIEIQFDDPEEAFYEGQESWDRSEIRKTIVERIEIIRRMRADSKRMIRARDGILTVIAGRPNVGKSSLMNQLLKKDRVLVSPEPGTTRDYIEEMLRINGVMIHLVDTAGIRNTEESVEKMGIRKTREWIDRAELVIYLLDSQEPIQLEDFETLEFIRTKPHLIVLNKTDTIPYAQEQEHIRGYLRQLAPYGNILLVSALHGNGIKELEEAIISQANSLLPGETVPAVTLQQHCDLVMEIEEILWAFLSALDEEALLDCLGDLLRKAVAYLDIMTGRTYTEDLVHTLFSRFCVGK